MAQRPLRLVVGDRRALVLLPSPNLPISNLRAAGDRHAAGATGAGRATAGSVLVLLRQPGGLLPVCRILQRSLARSASDTPGLSISRSSLKVNCAALTTILLFGGCVVPPMGPTIPVMPAPNKPFEVFRQDQAICTDYANQQVAGGAQQANNQQVLTGVAGTVPGAGLGAAIGGGRGATMLFLYAHQPPRRRRPLRRRGGCSRASTKAERATTPPVANASWFFSIVSGS